MAIISDVTELGSLVGKAISFVDQCISRWYDGSAELAAFPAKVSKLSASHAQWTSQLRRFGMLEDPLLAGLIEQADQLLDTEKAYVLKMQSKMTWFTKFKRKAFPGKLAYIFDNILAIVDAGPELIARRVDNFDLLEKNSAQTRVRLPFGPDNKYVTLPGPFTNVRDALEDADGPIVVTVHGGPGMGKTSLVKYVALHYQRDPKTFPDGVLYLDCGKGAEGRLEELQLELLENLGSRVRSADGTSSDSRGDREQETKYATSHRLERKLRSRLAQQKLLLILDDVWEVEVLERLFVPGVGLKYLITSQIRKIWNDAKMIDLSRPNQTEAREIMANHTEGLPIRGEFPESIKGPTDDIIKELEYHPLSLANVGIAINRNNATDPKEWEAARDQLQDPLHEDDLGGRPVAYGRRYPLALGPSMMMMVNSLSPITKRLLFIMVLLQGEGARIPAQVAEYFFTLIEPSKPKYYFSRHKNELENRSLLTLRSRFGGESLPECDYSDSRSNVILHGLRGHIIREMNKDELRSMATHEILGGCGVVRVAHDPSATNFHSLLSRMRSWWPGASPSLQSEDTDQIFTVMIMAAAYFESSFLDVVKTKLQTVTDHVLPRMASNGVDVTDLMQRSRGRSDEFKNLLCFLNPAGDDDWKRQAASYAKKVIIRFVVRGELDDESMACLIQMPETNSSACRAFKNIVRRCSFDFASQFLIRNITFSNTFGKISKSFLNLLHDDASTIGRRRAAIGAISEWVLPYENEDCILDVIKKWVELLAKDSNPALHGEIAEAIWLAIFSSVTRTVLATRTAILIGEVPDILESLVSLVRHHRKENSDTSNRTTLKAVEALYFLSLYSPSVALKMANISGAVELLVDMFQQPSTYDWDLRESCGLILMNLSSIPDNSMRFSGIQWYETFVRLSHLLSTRRVSGRRSHLDDYGRVPAIYAAAARILGNFALEDELRETIAKIPKDDNWLQFPQLQEIPLLIDASDCHYADWEDCHYVDWEDFMRAVVATSRAATIFLDATDANVNPPVYVIAATIPLEMESYGVYRGRAEAYENMKMYSEALAQIHVAHLHLQRLLVEWNIRRNCFLNMELQGLRESQIYMKVMLKDYEGATIAANNLVERFDTRNLTIRGVLHRLSGHLTEALADFDNALKKLSGYEIPYDILRHRGLVKMLMGDEEGARADAEAAELLKVRKLVWAENVYVIGPVSVIDLPVNYLGFALEARTVDQLQVLLVNGPLFGSSSA